MEGEAPTEREDPGAVGEGGHGRVDSTLMTAEERVEKGGRLRPIGGD